LEADKENLLVLGDGEQEKPYLHVFDLIEAILYVITNTNERLNYFNVAGKDRMKVKNIAAVLLEETGETRNIVFGGGKIGWVGDVPKFAYDINKIEQLGWKPGLNSEQAIRRTVSDIIKEKAAK
jgi:UDP-glucose 4-epimerase